MRYIEPTEEVQLSLDASSLAAKLDNAFGSPLRPPSRGFAAEFVRPSTQLQRPRTTGQGFWRTAVTGYGDFGRDREYLAISSPLALKHVASSPPALGPAQPHGRSLGVASSLPNGLRHGESALRLGTPSSGVRHSDSRPLEPLPQIPIKQILASRDPQHAPHVAQSAQLSHRTLARRQLQRTGSTLRVVRRPPAAQDLTAITAVGKRVVADADKPPPPPAPEPPPEEPRAPNMMRFDPPAPPPPPAPDEDPESAPVPIHAPVPPSSPLRREPAPSSPARRHVAAAWSANGRPVSRGVHTPHAPRHPYIHPSLLAQLAPTGPTPLPNVGRPAGRGAAAALHLEGELQLERAALREPRPQTAPSASSSTASLHAEVKHKPATPLRGAARAAAGRQPAFPPLNPVPSSPPAAPAAPSVVVAPAPRPPSAGPVVILPSPLPEASASFDASSRPSSAGSRQASPPEASPSPPPAEPQKEAEKEPEGEAAAPATEERLQEAEERSPEAGEQPPPAEERAPEPHDHHVPPLPLPPQEHFPAISLSLPSAGKEATTPSFNFLLDLPLPDAPAVPLPSPFMLPTTPTLSASPSMNLNLDIAGLTVVTTPVLPPSSFRFDLSFRPEDLTVAVKEPGPLASMAVTPLMLSPHLSVKSQHGKSASHDRLDHEASQTEANLTMAAMNALQLTGELKKYLEGEGDYEIDEEIAAETARNLERVEPKEPAKGKEGGEDGSRTNRSRRSVRILNMPDTDAEDSPARAEEAERERPASLGRAKTLPVPPLVVPVEEGAQKPPLSSKSAGWLTAPAQGHRPPSMDQLGGAMRQSVVMRALERQATRQQERRRVTKNVSFGRKGSQVEYEDDTMGAGAGSGRWWGSTKDSDDGSQAASETEHVGDEGAPAPDGAIPLSRRTSLSEESGGNTTRRMRKGGHIMFRAEDDVFVFNKSGTQSAGGLGAVTKGPGGDAAGGGHPSEGAEGGNRRASLENRRGSTENRRGSASPEEIQEKAEAIRKVPLRKQKSFRSESFQVLANISYHEIPIEDLELKERMGIGSFAEVFRSSWQGKEVAVKRYLSEIHKATKEEVATFRQEASIMSRLRHPNVIGLLGACTAPPHMALVMEFCQGGSLEKRLKEHWMGRELPRPIMYKIARDIAKGMAYLHGFEPPVVHRDLKAANIMLREASLDSWEVAIGDFGLSIDCDKSRYMTECGTLQYIAPEVLRSDPSNEKVDVYGYAMLLYEVIFRRVPYADLPVPPLMACMRAVYEGLRPTTAECPYPELLPLLDACWADEPKDRPEFPQVVEALDVIEEQYRAGGGG